MRIAEGPGHRRVTLDLAEAAGYFSAVPDFEKLFTDLNLDDYYTASPQSKLDSLYLPNTVLGCELLVSMPKLKTHHWTGATLSMKNLFGVVPGGAMHGRRTCCIGPHPRVHRGICMRSSRAPFPSSMALPAWKATDPSRARRVPWE